MSDNALETLFLSFEKNILSVPAGRSMFWGARHHPALGRFTDLQCVQSFHPYHALLTAPEWDGTSEADMALILLPKQKDEAQHDMALALRHIRAGGLIVVAASNDAGGNRIEKWMAELGLAAHSLPKNKARVCWAEKPAGPLPDTMTTWIKDGARRRVAIDGEEWMTQPGVFGWNRADAGSQLLMAHIPVDMKGMGADFGCGYGFLSRRVLAKNSAIETLLCIDADRRAVECCAENVTDTRAAFIWGDLSQPLDGVGDLDFIVMNPPFHEGKTTAPILGQDFIRTAGAALRKGGELWMVANVQLEYEAVLRETFRHGDKLVETGGFKVYRARK